MHIIIDGDPSIYRAGFSAESRSYDCVYEDPKTGDLVHRMFVPPKAGDKRKQYEAENPDLLLLEKDTIVEPKHVSHALQALKLSMEGIIADCVRKFKLNRNEITTTVLLSGPGNFRDDIATIKPYKGNRDAAHKPYHYQALRDYLCERYGAAVVEGHEADDEVSILSKLAKAAGEKYVVCTIDKDLDQVPGQHYDYLKKVFYWIDDFEAVQLFWRQIITGDSTDNIQGLHRVGDAAGDKMLAAWMEQFGLDPAKIWECIVKAYEKNMKKYPGKYPEGMGAQEAALENARLVKMQDYPGQLWTPPGQPDEETT